MTDYKCEACQDTGMTRSGCLDCMAPGCNAATERAAFNDRLGITGPWMLLDVAWTAYRMGKSDAEVSHGR